MNNEQKLYERLRSLGIPFQVHEHPAVFTVKESDKVLEILNATGTPFASTKNLFLADSEKNLWLIVACTDTIISLKELAQKLGTKKLHFAQAETLLAVLNVTAGSVTPFALINDTDHLVNVILDDRLFEHTAAGFHPLRNTATVFISPQDLQRFITSCGNTLQVMSIQHQA